ncbi:MAG: hypothetical protein A4E28_03002 [Methanocella sp. PtaU1.Bin125]|nr:MAG: hypothetical protein A4E28_03002 [Methanocella sp. PtaU1.Bin125]
MTKKNMIPVEKPSSTLYTSGIWKIKYAVSPTVIPITNAIVTNVFNSDSYITPRLSDYY